MSDERTGLAPVSWAVLAGPNGQKLHELQPERSEATVRSEDTAMRWRKRMLVRRVAFEPLPHLGREDVVAYSV